MEMIKGWSLTIFGGYFVSMFHSEVIIPPLHTKAWLLSNSIITFSPASEKTPHLWNFPHSLSPTIRCPSLSLSALLVDLIQNLLCGRLLVCSSCFWVGSLCGSVGITTAIHSPFGKNQLSWEMNMIVNGCLSHSLQSMSESPDQPILD